MSELKGTADEIKQDLLWVAQSREDLGEERATLYDQGRATATGRIGEHLQRLISVWRDHACGRLASVHICLVWPPGHP